MKPIIKICLLILGIIIALFALQAAILLTIDYFIDNDYKRMSLSINNYLHDRYDNMIEIKNRPVRSYYTLCKLVKIVKFRNDSHEEIGIMVIRYYTRKGLSIERKKEAYAQDNRELLCKDADNLIKGGVFCEDARNHHLKSLIFVRKHYFVRIYWREAENSLEDKVVGIASAVERGISDY